MTFELSGTNWSVRHIIAGELPPLADTGVTPLGLQPFIVHRFTLAPLVPESWADQRPKIVDDGGWGVDTTEPVFELLVKCLPRIWQGAADFAGALWNELPTVVDDVLREALLTDVASRVSRPFRRRVLRELGPYALLPDSSLDALTSETIAALRAAMDCARRDRSGIRRDARTRPAGTEPVDPAPAH